MVRRGQSGFTIAELVIVVVVIAILAVISVVAYKGIQARARDDSMRNIGVKAAEALQLFAAKNGRWPNGGSSSTQTIGSATECPDGATGNGWFQGGSGYNCTIGESLEASGYLPQDFDATLPKNTVFAGANRSLMFYRQSNVSDNGATKIRGMLYYSLESPSAADTTNFNNEMTQCGINPAGAVLPRDSWGMRGGICVEYTI